ncbi:hypothetical protein F8538_13220 [Edwardsiella ictaluri]|uniref:hypothetical protein n=1 Tax=Edwardsiella ictaluri TaxID=67780 RepID=UPI0012DC1EA4|nr:hypothetical protein [Edwardsiella ictaluri]QPW27641.1 hypothetical protein F8538_13220 [Edwardsiella ictaluri]
MTSLVSLGIVTSVISVVNGVFAKKAKPRANKFNDEIIMELMIFFNAMLCCAKEH